MKVNTPPPSTPELVQPGGARSQGQSEHALEQDADLFKQAMGDTAPPSNQAGFDGKLAGKSGLARQTGQTGVETVPPTSADSPALGENDAEAKLRMDEVGLDSGADVQRDLRQLLAEQMMRSQTASMQRAEASAAETISPQLVSDVAQRILVSAGKEGHAKEVRIQIKDSLLQDKAASEV